MGGSQRLTGTIGKGKAMDLMLTGRTMDTHEAERTGLVSCIVPNNDLHDQALTVASTIVSMSTPIAALAKESVNRAFETTLTEGLLFERCLFHSTFATQDQKEGMSAFTEKRPSDVRPRLIHLDDKICKASEQSRDIRVGRQRIISLPSDARRHAFEAVLQPDHVIIRQRQVVMSVSLVVAGVRAGLAGSAPCRPVQDVVDRVGGADDDTIP